MSSQSQNVLKSNSLGKSRMNLLNKKSLGEKRNSLQKDQVDTQTFRHNLLQQASQKYIQQQESNVDFSASQIMNEFQKQAQRNRTNNSANTVKNTSTVRNTKMIQNSKQNQQKMAKNNGIQHKKKLYAASGRTVSSNNPDQPQVKQSDANKILEFQNEDQSSQQLQEKQSYASTLYHQPYSNFMAQQSNSFPNQAKRNQHPDRVNQDFQKTTSINSDHQLFLTELQTIIFSEVKTMELKQLKGNYILEHITDDLEIEIGNLQAKIKSEKLSAQELLKTRTHIQALCKIMVFVHGKSQYRLVASHYYIGQAYRLNGCYEQAIDHFTISLKKNAKLTQIKETKIYHSFILTSLSECYFELEMYSDALQILLRAYEIQQCYVNSELKINNIKTIRLVSECYLKMKNYRQAIEYMEKICLIVERLKGNNSKDYAEMKFEKAVIVGEEGNLLGAIDQVRAAIDLVQSNTIIEPFQKQMIILQYSKKLAEFLQNFGDFESQVSCLKQMLKIIDSQKAQGFTTKRMFINHIIAIKKKIIVIAVKHSDFPIAIKQLEQVLTLQQQKYGSDSVYVGKTLKMLGLVHLHLGNERHAQEYFKKCYNMNQQSKESKGEMREIQRIFKSLGYQNRPSFSKKSVHQGHKKLSIS